MKKGGLRRQKPDPLSLSHCFLIHPPVSLALSLTQNPETQKPWPSMRTREREIESMGEMAGAVRPVGWLVMAHQRRQEWDRKRWRGKVAVE